MTPSQAYSSHTKDDYEMKDVKRDMETVNGMLGHVIDELEKNETKHYGGDNMSDKFITADNIVRTYGDEGSNDLIRDVWNGTFQEANNTCKTIASVHAEGRNIDNRLADQTFVINDKINTATTYTNDKTGDAFRTLDGTVLQTSARVNDTIRDVQRVTNDNSLKLGEGLVALGAKVAECCCETKATIVAENQKVLSQMAAYRDADQMAEIAKLNAKVTQLETIKALGCEPTCNTRSASRNDDLLINLAIKALGGGASATGIL